MPEENLVDVVKDIVKKTTDLTLENMVLRNKLNIAMKAFDDILEFKRTGYFGLNFDVWQIIKKAMDEIEEIK